MAYDKVVDSAVLNAGLKQIADAIREKAGTSDSLAFPTAMAEAIAAIAAGGSDIAGHPFVAGSFTLAEDATSSITISTDTELWEPVSGRENSCSNCYTFLFIDPLPESASLTDYPEMLIASINSYVTQDVSNYQPRTVVYLNSSGVYSVKKFQNDTVSGLRVYNKKLLATFASSYKGYAGTTYTWLIVRAF